MPEAVLRRLGQSREGSPLSIWTWVASPPAPTILFLGGVHGDETEGVWLLEEAVKRWTQATQPPSRLGVTVFSQVNPDGVKRVDRRNAAGVDLNRNLPTRDWSPTFTKERYHPGPSPGSEPENQVLLALLAELKPIAVLSAHSFDRYQININGPAREWGERLAARCGYPVTEDIGYPTPGCLGTYLGHERGIPTITLEIPKGMAREDVITRHFELLEQTLRYWEDQTR